MYLLHFYQKKKTTHTKEYALVWITVHTGYIGILYFTAVGDRAVQYCIIKGFTPTIFSKGDVLSWAWNEISVLGAHLGFK